LEEQKFITFDKMRNNSFLVNGFKGISLLLPIYDDMF